MTEEVTTTGVNNLKGIVLGVDRRILPFQNSKFRKWKLNHHLSKCFSRQMAPLTIYKDFHRHSRAWAGQTIFDNSEKISKLLKWAFNWFSKIQKLWRKSSDNLVGGSKLYFHFPSGLLLWKFSLWFFNINYMIDSGNEIKLISSMMITIIIIMMIMIMKFKMCECQSPATSVIPITGCFFSMVPPWNDKVWKT